MNEPQPTGKPGKYQRSAAGLVVSMVVTVVAVVGLLWVMGLFRAETAIEPERVDYLEGVRAAQESDLRPATPASLPKGWLSTGVDVTPGDDPAFAFKFLTDDDRFVGIRQEDSSPQAVVAAHVDDEAAAADGYTTARSVAREWEGFTDEDGDTAYVAEVGDQVVLVYGSAPAEDLQAVVDSLTRKPAR